MSYPTRRKYTADFLKTKQYFEPLFETVEKPDFRVIKAHGLSLGIIATETQAVTLDDYELC